MSKIIYNFFLLQFILCVKIKNGVSTKSFNGYKKEETSTEVIENEPNHRQRMMRFSCCVLLLVCCVELSIQASLPLEEAQQEFLDENNGVGILKSNQSVDSRNEGKIKK